MKRSAVQTRRCPNKRLITQGLEFKFDKLRVGGSNPPQSRLFNFFEEMTEWSKVVDCKSIIKITQVRILFSSVKGFWLSGRKQ
jgi:hypothetical protein